MNHLDVAILKTIIYADNFHFPMTADEIHHFLISDVSVDLATIEHQLQASRFLAENLCFDGTYYALATRQEIFDLRHSREQMMEYLSAKVMTYGRLLVYFPFVELVGVTGALSMRNPSTTTDDLDYLIVTRPGRVWMARGFIILLVRLMRLRDIEICPNYVLASNQLSQARRDMYIAHEVAQLLPLCNPDLYQQFRQQNQWTQDFLPNAHMPFHKLVDKPMNRLGVWVKRGIEAVLSTSLGDWLEKWEYRRKVRRFQQQATAPTASAEIDEGHVKGHFEDYGQYVLQQYQEQLTSFGIDDYEIELKSVGD